MHLKRQVSPLPQALKKGTGHLLGRNWLISQGRVSKFFRVSAVNTGSSFAPFAALREARAGSLAKTSS